MSGLIYGRMMPNHRCLDTPCSLDNTLLVVSPVACCAHRVRDIYWRRSHVLPFVSFLLCHRRLPSNINFSCQLLAFTHHIPPFIQLRKDEQQYCKLFISHLIPTQRSDSTSTEVMCIQVVERYAVCRCIYYRHAVDPCPGYGRRDHRTIVKEVSVGYKCSKHSTAKQYTTSQHYNYPDSGYGSGSSSRPQSGGFRR